MANAFFFILLCIGCWRSFVTATDPCVPKVRGEPFVQYVEKNNCEVDEKLSKLFNHMSFNETANFMCIGFIDALSCTSDLTLESICRFGLLGDIPDGNFCSDTKMMTVLEKVTSPMFNKSSPIVANFTRQHCDMMCDILSDGSNELCWAFGITAKLVQKQSVVSTTPPITAEPSVTTQSLVLPALHPFDKTNTATSDGDDDDSHDNYKDEDHDHNNDDHEHNNDDHDHNDDDHDHNDDDHDHSDDDHDHSDDEHDHISDEHDHNDEEHEHVNDGHDGATDSTTDKLVKVENDTSGEDDNDKMGPYFDPHNTQDKQNVSNTVGQDVGEGNKKHDDGVTGTDITDNQEALTSISDEGTQDVHDNAINQATNTNDTDIATDKVIASDEGNTSTPVELDPNDDDLFDDSDVDGDQNGKQNDDDDDSDQDNSDHDGSVNYSHVIEIDDDDDDGYSYWHFATILLFILFIGVAGYLASHNRKKV